MYYNEKNFSTKRLCVLFLCLSFISPLAYGTQTSCLDTFQDGKLLLKRSLRDKVGKLLTEEIKEISFFIKQYQGQDALLRLTDRLSQSLGELVSMDDTYSEVSRLLRKSFFQLKWQLFIGTTEQYKTLKNQAVDSNGRIIEKYRVKKGLDLFAKEHFDSNILIAYLNAKALFSKEDIGELAWDKQYLSFYIKP